MKTVLWSLIGWVFTQKKNLDRKETGRHQLGSWSTLCKDFCSTSSIHVVRYSSVWSWKPPDTSVPLTPSFLVHFQWCPYDARKHQSYDFRNKGQREINLESNALRVCRVSETFRKWARSMPGARDRRFGRELRSIMGRWSLYCYLVRQAQLFSHAFIARIYFSSQDEGWLPNLLSIHWQRTLNKTSSEITSEIRAVDCNWLVHLSGIVLEEGLGSTCYRFFLFPRPWSSLYRP